MGVSSNAKIHCSNTRKQSFLTFLSRSIFFRLTFKLFSCRIVQNCEHNYSFRTITMKKLNVFGLFAALTVIVLMGSCKKDSTPPLSERIAKIWSANIVKEGSTVVYTKGAASNNKPGYSNFKLDLSSQTSAKLIEYDGNTFTGQWSLSSDDKTLTLTNLNPQPTGTGGTISFTINEVTDTSLKITRTSASAKTGGTINDYQLANP